MHSNTQNKKEWLQWSHSYRNLVLKSIAVFMIFLLVVFTVRVSVYSDFSQVPATNRTLGFQKIFALSLPSRTDRQDSLQLATAVADLEVDFADGVWGKDVDEVAFPIGMTRKTGNGYIGSWRGHMNIIRRIIHQRITSALIIEDDVDWDVRIKEQMGRVIDKLQTSSFTKNWDIIWLGTLGDRIPDDESQRSTIYDPTVPRNLSSGNAGVSKHFSTATRVLHRSDYPLSTLAYAVTYEGAQRILYHLSVDGLPYEFDTSLADTCRSYMNCFSVTPGIFHEYLPPGTKGKDSDNREKEEGKRTKPLYSQNIDISIRESIDKEFRQLVRKDKEWLDELEIEIRFSEASKGRFREAS
ncbi:hypothetical protein ACMFMG_012071 [Clarireedia jacksonii]